MSTPTPTTNDLRPFSRHITTHDPSGHAVFSSALPPTVPPTHAGGALFHLAYTTTTFPTQLSVPAATATAAGPTETDISTYTTHLTQSPPGLTISSGTVLRVVDFPPGMSSAMHRTQSLDYAVVLEGEVEIALDSGEKRSLRRGDVVVQRGTNHVWKNVSEPADGEGGWARMLYVLVAAEPVEVGGRRLGEELEGMQGVRASE
ncbi:MAG: hypothetical protein M1819_000455 [Sarea resinae]|nr:MAG: hypothetical protein M1819_000455 [Sarea resinae]